MASVDVAKEVECRVLGADPEVVARIQYRVRQDAWTGEQRPLLELHE